MYSHVFVAGTFDGLHVGHKALLSAAFKIGGFVTIGLTPDDYVAKFKPHPEEISTFAVRKNAVQSWILEKNYASRAEIIPIIDNLEPAASGNFDAIIVSTATKPGALAINTKRQEKVLPLFSIIEIPMQLAEDGTPISSTRVRNGEIDTEGHLILPPSIREQLQQPIGTIIPAESIPQLFQNHTSDVIVTVGDVTTVKFLNGGVVPKLSIIDLTAERKPYDTLSAIPLELRTTFMCIQSGPGYLSQDAINAVRGAYQVNEKSIIVVDGEEDLLTLPAIFYAPNGTRIYYGQPKIVGQSETEGLVEVVVNDAVREKIKAILDTFGG